MKCYDLKKASKEFDDYYSEYDTYKEQLLSAFEEIYKERDTLPVYELKARNIEYMCQNAPVKIFRHSPFFFEFASGRPRCSWGGLSSPVGSFLHIKTSALWLDKYYEEMKKDNEEGRVQCWNNPVGFDHFSLGYDKLLSKGLEGIIQDAQTALGEKKKDKEKEFLKSVISTCESLITLANRFSEKAEELLSSSTDEEDKRHYKEIAEIAKRVPLKPASDFCEALSCIMFCREAIGSLEGVGVSTFGHLDRMLIKYYRIDKENGKLTYDEMKNLFHMMFVYTDTRFEVNIRRQETSTTMIIGGCDENGDVCFNEVTEAILDALLEGGYVNTKVNCRVSSKHPEKYIKKIAGIQLAGIPAVVFQNDDVIIPSRVKCGQDISDARTYVSGGCHEITLQNSEVCTRADTWINLPRLLLDAFGKSKAKTFDAFYNDVLYEIESYVQCIIERKNKYEKMWNKFDPLPLLSATMDGCIEKALDITEGGTKYNNTALSFLSPATLIDSLVAIRILVFEEKKLSLEGFFKICEENFDGMEELKERIINDFPKYGVGNGEIDKFAAKVMKDISELYRDENGLIYKNARGGYYLPAFYPHGCFLSLGSLTSATPDGRMAGMPLSRGCSPSEFIPSDNPASVLVSLEEIDFTDYADSFCTELTLPRMEADKGISVLTALINMFIKNGSSTLQFNLLDRDLLIRAQQSPEQYNNIIVRVCGYSARFVTIYKELQDEIILRAIR